MWCRSRSGASRCSRVALIRGRRVSRSAPASASSMLPVRSNSARMRVRNCSRRPSDLRPDRHRQSSVLDQLRRDWSRHCRCSSARTASGAALRRGGSRLDRLRIVSRAVPRPYQPGQIEAGLVPAENPGNGAQIFKTTTAGTPGWARADACLFEQVDLVLPRPRTR